MLYGVGGRGTPSFVFREPIYRRAPASPSLTTPLGMAWHSRAHSQREEGGGKIQLRGHIPDQFLAVGGERGERRRFAGNAGRIISKNGILSLANKTTYTWYWCEKEEEGDLKRIFEGNKRYAVELFSAGLKVRIS